MAGGCIIGTCPVCDDLVFEDEWQMTNDEKIVHEKCLLHAEFNQEETDIIADLQKRLDEKDKQVASLLRIIREIEQGAHPKLFKNQIQRIMKGSGESES